MPVTQSARCAESELNECPLMVVTLALFLFQANQTMSRIASCQFRRLWRTRRTTEASRSRHHVPLASPSEGFGTARSHPGGSRVRPLAPVSTRDAILY